MTRPQMQMLEEIANLSLAGKDVVVACTRATAEEWRIVLEFMPHRSERVRFLIIDGDENV